MDTTNILVVFDPTREAQPALERAASIAALLPCTLHVFCCIHDELPRSKDRAAAVRRKLDDQRTVVEKTIAALDTGDATVTVEMEWDQDWYRAVVRASISRNADVVLKSTYRHSSGQRILNRTSDWTLIRECLCPVLLVREGSSGELQKVLAAIDVRARSDAYQRINQRIIDFSHRVLDQGGAEVHFINAFRELKEAPDRNALVKACGIDGDRIHLRMGEPDEVIVQSAREMNVSLVVVGNSARSGLAAVMRGNTVEKVLDKLACDVLSLP
jgi:universal stress protein E